MRNNARHALLLISAAALAALSCGTPESDWKGSMEEVSGVTVVKNPPDPMHGEGALHLEEDLLIVSDEEGGTFLFNWISHITADRQGRMYALDRNEAHVLVFDPDGAYVRTISRKGQGPKELNAPIFLYISADRLMIFQFERISFFSLEGEHLKTVPTAREQLRRVRMNSRNQMIATSLLFDEQRVTHKLKIYDSQGSPIREITSLPVERKPGTIQLFGPNIYMTVMDNDEIVYGYSDRYELQVYSPEGDLTRRISREFRPVRVTEEEKAAESEHIPSGINLKIFESHPPFIRFIHDEQGRLFVQTMEKGFKPDTFFYDIFDPEGRFIARARFQQYPVLFMNGRLYSLVEDEEGYQAIKRYRVTWTI